MVVFPNCKINLGLQVIRKRDDGFHDLETVFYPVNALKDALEILRQPGATSEATDPVNFHISGLQVDGPVSGNLCVKAWQLLKKDFPSLPAVEMHLHKVIPMGAGLGGGSADGAFALTLLNSKFHLGLSEAQLISYALQLGSDCPFFIVNKPSFATGRGEFLQTIPLDLAGYFLVLVNPGIHVNTGWAFGQIHPRNIPGSLEQQILAPADTWKNTIFNDFEAPVARAYPVIGNLKTTLYNHGAVYASMSGSGSTVYGLFEAPVLPPRKMFPGMLELHLSI